jgi:hypothetical protein
MGFYFRKSARFGPFRVNFSKSGVGLSAGIPGLRIGTGPRGNYIQAGAHGFYYRATLPSSRSTSRGPIQRQQAPTIPIQSPRPSPVIPDGTLGDYVLIESSDAGTMVDSSSEALLDEIHKKHKAISSWRWAAVLALTGVVIAWANTESPGLIGAAALIGAIFVAYAYRWDVQRKLTILHYELNQASIDAFGALRDAAAHLQKCSRIWHLNAQAEVYNKKYHAGASATVKRSVSAVGASLPPFLASNVDPVTLTFGRQTLYFFPDRILVYQGSHVGAVGYRDLGCNAGRTRFIEEESVPRDSQVVDRTWRFVNKKGGPDRRFGNNREIPVCLYGELTLSSRSGINEVLHVSNAAEVDGFAVSIAQIAKTAS